jgi:uncharacterized protein (TIGR02246 family)
MTRLAAEDRDEIRELMARYNHLMDSYSADEFAELFTEDGTWELVGVGQHSGTSELQSFIKSIADSSGSHLHRHCVFNEVIEIRGDSAVEKSYVMDWLCSPSEPPQLIALGRYEDQLRRANGRWLFAYRRLDCDWLVSRDGRKVPTI